MEPDILKKAGQIVGGIIESRDPYQKIAILLKVIPIECFDEAFRFFHPSDRKKITKALETKVCVNSVETKLIVQEFIRKNDLDRFLKTATRAPEETLAAFQKFSGKNPRKIGQMMEDTWLSENF